MGSEVDLSLAAPLRTLARAAAPTHGVAKLADRAGMVLLTLAVGTLLLRPADLIPALAGAPVYEILIMACLAVVSPRVLGQLSRESLRANGVKALALLLVAAVALSHLSHLNTYDARRGGVEMAKACALFLLVVALVDTRQKLQALLFALMAGVYAAAVLAVLHYHGVLELPALGSVEQRVTGPGDGAVLIRLCGTGVFNDPNDFALILVVAAIISAYGLGDRRAGRARWVLLVPLAVCGYAIILTHSRGGLIAAVAGALAFLTARLGWRNVIPAACLLIPLLLAPFWGRQASVNLDDPDDTFQTRLGLWSDSLEVFRSAPLLGIGQGKLTDTIGQVTHNSYLHAFAEMGLLGGTVFIGAFYLVLCGLWRASPTDDGLARLRPCLLAVAVSYATGLLSLSRCYTVPTQLVLALATAYLVLASRTGPMVIPHLDWPWARRITGVGVGFLAATYVFVRLMAQRG